MIIFHKEINSENLEGKQIMKEIIRQIQLKFQIIIIHMVAGLVFGAGEHCNKLDGDSSCERGRWML